MIAMMEPDGGNAKPCKKCGGTERTNDGKCKACYTEYQRRYREKNAEELREYRRRYREENAEKIAEYSRHSRENNREKFREYGRRHYEKNRDKVREHTRLYYENNRDVMVALQCAYQARIRKENPEKLRENSLRYLARKKFMLMTGMMFRIKGLCEEKKTKPNNENENE